MQHAVRTLAMRLKRVGPNLCGVHEHCADELVSGASLRTENIRKARSSALLAERMRTKDVEARRATMAERTKGKEGV